MALRPAVRAGAQRSAEPVPAWAEPGGATGAWTPSSSSGGADVAAPESPFPFGAALPFEPDPEAAAFLNAPRRPLAFYVAPFGTPPFGNPPSTRPSLGGAVGGAPEWGPAYPAGA